MTEDIDVDLAPMCGEESQKAIDEVKAEKEKERQREATQRAAIKDMTEQMDQIRAVYREIFDRMVGTQPIRSYQDIFSRKYTSTSSSSPISISPISIMPLVPTNPYTKGNTYTYIKNGRADGEKK